MDLRDFVALCEEAGELKRITAEVDWDLELSHISKLNEANAARALLFENVKGHQSPVLTGAFTTTGRIGLALGIGNDVSMIDVTKQWMNLMAGMDQLIPARELPDGPIFENRLNAEEVDVLTFPAPRFYERDGGRYFGTMAYMVVKDPETGSLNIGVYRMAVLDHKTVGVQLLKGKKADTILQKYARLGQKMPACAIIGGDPLLFLSAAAMMTQSNGYDVVGTLRGQPIDVVRAPFTGLPIPALAEIVLEGEIDPIALRNEGPLGEYTGYYTDELYRPTPKPALEVKAIYHRNVPILWETSGGRPVSDIHTFVAFIRSAMIWSDLTLMKIPGIKSVYVLPESAAQFWVVISVEQMYPGHSNQVAAALTASNVASYAVKGAIIVDSDIDADDLPRVWWALSTRYNPSRDTLIMKRVRAAPLDPSFGPAENKDIGSRIILDATTPFDWQEKPIEVRLTQHVVDKIKTRWKELGLE